MQLKKNVEWIYIFINLQGADRERSEEYRLQLIKVILILMFIYLTGQVGLGFF